MRIHSILLVFFHVFVFITQAQEKSFSYTDSTGVVLLGKHLDLLIDKTNKLTINEIENNKNLITSDQIIPSYGISGDTYWSKFTINNQTSSTEDFYLEFNKIDVIKLNLYHRDGDQIISPKIRYDQKKMSGRVFLFDIEIPQNTSKTFYLEYKTNWNATLPLKFASKEKLLLKLFNYEIVNGIFIGVFLIMVFYNLFVYLSVKDRSYLFYVIYIFFFLLYQINENGYFHKYFLYKTPYVYSILAKLLPMLTAISAIYFIRNFIQSPKYIPKVDQFHYILVGLFAANIFFVFDTKYNPHAYASLNILSLIAALYAYLMGVLVMLKGFKPAKFFLIAWTILVLSIATYTLTNLGFVPYTDMTDHLLKIGSVIEIVLLSLGLANRINVLTKENEIAQAKALKLASEKETIILNQKEELEKQVKERTKSLRLKNETIVKQNEEKSTMMKEIHHRVKNNLQMINSMIRLQTRFVDDSDSKDVLNKVQRRILTMAQLHEKMYQTENLKYISTHEYIKEILTDLFNIYNENNSVSYELNIDEKIQFEPEPTLYIGLLVSELVINTLKHAFDGDGGIVLVKLKKVTSHSYELSVSDNGKGFDKEIFNTNNSLGQRLIKNFVKQINGQMNVNSTKYGSEFEIRFVID